MHPSDFTPYVRVLKHLAETANVGNLPDSLSRYATMRVLRDEMIELAQQISDEDRSVNHMQGIKKLNLAVSVFREAAITGLDQPPFPRPPGRPIGSFRGLPQKANS
jgi:hypothetical protein